MLRDNNPQIYPTPSQRNRMRNNTVVRNLLLMLLVVFLLFCSWAVFPRSVAGMTEIVDRISLPQSSQLISEETVASSPLCLESLVGPCPHVRREWNLDRELSDEEVKEIIEKTNPDFYLADEENHLDNDGYCTSRCNYMARITTDKKYKVEITNKSDGFTPAAISISIKEIGWYY